MNKTYITPKMKAMPVETADILCLSNPDGLDIYKGETVSEEENKYSDDEGYGEAW